MTFSFGDIAVGGKHEYTTVYDSSGSFSQAVHVTDTGTLSGPTDSGPQTFIMGCTFRPTTGDLYTASSPSQTAPNTPHDVDWIPDDSGLLVAVVLSAGVLEFRRYNFDGSLAHVYSPSPLVEVGWAQQPVKISVACDARTVFYTQSLYKVQRYDLQTESQLADYLVMNPVTSPYIFGGLRAHPRESGDDRDIVVAMTATGVGPRRAVCLDSDGSSFWWDLINATPYQIEKRHLVTEAFEQLITTQYDGDSGHNDATLSLACYYNPCFRPLWVGFTAVIS